MLVSGGWWGGGGVPHQFLLSFQVGNELVIFKASGKKEIPREVYLYKGFPPKDLEKFYSKTRYYTRMRACKAAPQGR